MNDYICEWKCEIYNDEMKMKIYNDEYKCAHHKVWRLVLWNVYKNTVQVNTKFQWAKKIKQKSDKTEEVKFSTHKFMILCLLFSICINLKF